MKVVSGINEDGDSLRNKAFAADKQTPVVQFHGLTTESERDEQRGLLFLFKGIVGIRNSKAHHNRLFDDPKRAHEYLALSSLLMRLLEIAKEIRYHSNNPCSFRCYRSYCLARFTTTRGNNFSPSRPISNWGAATSALHRVGLEKYTQLLSADHL